MRGGGRGSAQKGRCIQFGVMPVPVFLSVFLGVFFLFSVADTHVGAEAALLMAELTDKSQYHGP